MPEISIVSDAVEGTLGDLDGESRHEQVEAKLSRRGREMLNEGEEIRSPKSEETQDYVREAKSTEYEEEEERSFVPSPVSVPLKPFLVVTISAAKRPLSCWQLASVVLNEGDETYTTNLRQKCFTNTYRQKEKNRCQMCSGDRWWKRRRIVEECGK